MDMTELVLAQESDAAMMSDFWLSVPSWAQDIITRACDLDTGIASGTIPWTPAAVKHLKSAISCAKSINHKMNNDLVFAANNGIVVGEIKTRKKRKVHGRVNKPSEAKFRVTTNPKVRVEDKSAGKKRKGVK